VESPSKKELLDQNNTKFFLQKELTIFKDIDKGNLLMNGCGLCAIRESGIRNLLLLFWYHGIPTNLKLSFVGDGLFFYFTKLNF
jgi:hypothetical protein